MNCSTFPLLSTLSNKYQAIFNFWYNGIIKQWYIVWSSGCSASLLFGSIYKLASSTSSVPASALTCCSLFPQTVFFCCHNCSPLLSFLRSFLFFYIHIYTLNKKIYNHQAYIYMLLYTWEQKNIHMKYQKIHPKNNRKIKIIKRNQRKKRTKIWILNATSMVKPWLPEFIKKALH